MTNDLQTQRAAALVRQHAQTSKLLGVDFVPSYRSGADRPATVGPHSRELATSVATAADSPTAPPADYVAGVSIPPGVAADARRLAVSARLRVVLDRYIADAPHKHFVTAHTNIVFGDGDPCARLMFIGEAPGADEDRTGVPFVGRAGQLLNKMIAAMGLRREDVYIANVLKTRPPNNATPTSDEAARCAEYLYDQIEAVQPEAIVTLGLPATRLILGTDAPMGSLRGRWATWRRPGKPAADACEVPVMPTFHPAFLLRQYTPENRAKVWSDLRAAMAKLGPTAPVAPVAGR